MAALLALAAPAAAEGVNPNPDSGGTGQPPASRAPIASATPDDLIVAPDRKYVTPHAIAQILRTDGFAPDLFRDAEGDIAIRFKVEGANIVVFFYDCTKDPVPRCKGIQFHAGYGMGRPVAAELINRWNAGRRYVRAYVIPERPASVRLKMDLSASGGMTADVFRAHFILFRRLEPLFRRHIGFRL